MYITDHKQLKEFVARAKNSPLLAVDTEFLREKTYWPRLCLIQLATEEESVVVDPFRVTDLSALAELFVDEKIVKLFHAAGQDMELIVHEMGVIPKPVFDTQIAASLLGDTLQIGYGALVLNECGVKLKKADSFTDWSRRPLTDSQVEYALDDVIYLPRIYRSMKARLEGLGRLSWLDRDFEELSDPDRYRVDPFERYKRLKRVNQLTPQQLSAAREVAAWRDTVAMKRNIPRKWVMTDEQIVEICKREPRSLDELFMVRGVSNALKTGDARSVLAACSRGLDVPEEQWPELNKSYKSEPNVDPQVDLLYSLVKIRAKEAGVAFGVLASHADLAKLVRGHYDEVDILKGWRRHLVGEELLSLMRGEIMLGIEDGLLKVTDCTR
ncbi:MAG: ribonuclease D [Slackia sp.]|nr:ribonuclease D [Slackia sp.]